MSPAPALTTRLASVYLAVAILPTALASAASAATSDDEVSADTEAPRVSAKKRRASRNSETHGTVSATMEHDSGPLPEALVLAVGSRAVARSLSFNQDIYSRNKKYTLPIGPEVAFAADFYPAALASAGFASNIGLTGQVSYLIPGSVTTSGDAGTGNYGAKSLDFSGGIKIRLPGGLFLTGAYGDLKYELIPQSGAPTSAVPTVEYKYVRAGGGVRYRATSDLSLMANGAYLRCLSLGAIGQQPFYPKGTGAGFEAGVAIGYRVTQAVELQVGGDLRRYGLAFHQNINDLPSAPTDPNIRVAGGAVDQFMSGWVALAFVLGGEMEGNKVAGGAAAEVPEEPKETHERKASSHDAEEAPAPAAKTKSAPAEEAEPASTVESKSESKSEAEPAEASEPEETAKPSSPATPSSESAPALAPVHKRKRHHKKR